MQYADQGRGAHYYNQLFPGRVQAGSDLHRRCLEQLLPLALHLLALYGTAFAMTTFFLWISDPGAFVQVVIRFVNTVLTGATLIDGTGSPLSDAGRVIRSRAS